LVELGLGEGVFGREKLLLGFEDLVVAGFAGHVAQGGKAGDWVRAPGRVVLVEDVNEPGRFGKPESHQAIAAGSGKITPKLTWRVTSGATARCPSEGFLGARGPC